MRRHAFTLIELLVVIAIIAILAAILFPVFAQAKAAAKQTQCLSQLKQIDTGLLMYTSDNDSSFPTIIPYTTPINGGGGDHMSYDGQLMPYIKNDAIFKCPTDAAGTRPPHVDNSIFWDGSYLNKNVKRSYGIIGNVYTAQANGKDRNTGLGVNSGYDQYPDNLNLSGKSDTGFDDTANSLALTENWFDVSGVDDSWIGEPYGSAFQNCDVVELPGRQYPPAGPADNPPPGCDNPGKPAAKSHTSGTVYAFVDGHAKLLNYYKVRANDYYMFKATKPTNTVTP